MNSIKYLRANGLKELRKNGLKGMRVSGLKALIFKPRTADANIKKRVENVDYLTKKREPVKRKIIKLIKEKKEIETRIDLIQKAEEEKNEEISELPWWEEIFPPLPRKVRVKMSGTLEAKNDSLHTADTGFSEIKVSGMEIEVKGIDEKSEEKTPEVKTSEDMISDTSQTIVVNNAEKANPKSRAGEKKEDKTYLENAEKIEVADPFSIGKMSENKVSSGNSSSIPIDKAKPENKNNSSASLFGNNLIEELLNSDDLYPEEEQSFMKDLEEPEVGELLTELKNVKALLVRAEHAG
ncbi:hypothetical protein [Methanosarcina sp. WWM596]|uniref:hypothetical protein n=1 Tax=Methanosarcina sp. WWM596 TaxID=1434103 RepID=UPI000615ACEB|nr:hypothetical protein [Methanosarcina sp. WWM596]AKB17891.1 hypothetical protein MSWHS_1028 [Methanosarcina sp. WWM596]